MKRRTVAFLSIVIILFVASIYYYATTSNTPSQSTSSSSTSTTTAFRFTERFSCYNLNMTTLGTSTAGPATSSQTTSKGSTFTGTAIPWINYSAYVDGPLCMGFEFHTTSSSAESLGLVTLQVPASFGYSIVPQGIPQGFAPSDRVSNRSSVIDYNSTVPFQTPQHFIFILVPTQQGLYSVTFWQEGVLQARFRISAVTTQQSGTNQ